MGDIAVRWCLHKVPFAQMKANEWHLTLHACAWPGICAVPLEIEHGTLPSAEGLEEDTAFGAQQQV